MGITLPINISSWLLHLPYSSSWSIPDSTTTNAFSSSSASSTSTSVCSLYWAPSTLPQAGMGVFTGISRKLGDPITQNVGFGDVAIPLMDLSRHLSIISDSTKTATMTTNTMSFKNLENQLYQYSLLSNYVWNWNSFGMDREAFEGSAWVPGLGAAVNGWSLGSNIQLTYPTQEWETTLDIGDQTRSASFLYGSRSPYTGIFSHVIRRQNIPAGAELWLDYGEQWFQLRHDTQKLANPNRYRSQKSQTTNTNPHLYESYHLLEAKQIWKQFVSITSSLKFSSKNSLQNDLWKLIQQFPFSSPITSLFPPRLEQVIHIVHNLQQNHFQETTNLNDHFHPQSNPFERTLSYLFQESIIKTPKHSLDYLEQHGSCWDTIQPGKSSLSGAGLGAFVTRSFAMHERILASPVLHIPDRSILTMYKKIWSEYGLTWKRNSSHVESYQLLLNYCYGHMQSTVLLCPYGPGISFINHNQSLANVGIRWIQPTKNDKNVNSTADTNPSSKKKQKRPPSSSILDIYSHHDSTLLELTAQELHQRDSPSQRTLSSAGLIWEFMTLRPISSGEELFFDAGDAWENAWKEHSSHFSENKNQNSFTANEVVIPSMAPSKVWNDREIVLRTRDEQRHNPYPHDLHCHDVLTEDYFGWKEVISQQGSNLWKPSDRGCRCTIVRRYVHSYTDKDINQDKNARRNYVYDVNFFNDDFEDKNDDEVQNYGVPRTAFRFFDRPYSSELHSPNAFRFPYQIPDDMLPEAWKAESAKTSTTTGSKKSKLTPKLVVTSSKGEKKKKLKEEDASTLSLFKHSSSLPLSFPFSVVKNQCYLTEEPKTT
jgi:hypothetical protein